VTCKWFAYGPPDVTATPIVSCFIKIQNGSTFLVLAYLGCSGKEAIKRVSVCLCLSRVLSEQHTAEANEHVVDASRLDESTVTSVQNESSLAAGDVTADSVQVHVR